MATDGAKSALSDLWQVPLLGMSVVAFAGSLVLLAKMPVHDLVAEKIAVAKKKLDADQPRPALDVLNAIESDLKPTRAHEAEVRVMMARAVDMAQRAGGERVPQNDATIVRQYHLAELAGAKLTVPDYISRGEAEESLGRKAEAVKSFAHALAADANLWKSLGRRALELELATGMEDEASEGLPKYAALPGLTDADKAWAAISMADIHFNRGSLDPATALLEKARVLDVPNVTKGRIACRQGEIAHAQGDDAEAERQFMLARNLLGVGSELDAIAAYKLGAIRMARGDAKLAADAFRDVLLSHPGSDPFVLSRLGRGCARIMLGDDDAGLEDLAWATAQLAKPEVRRKDGAEALSMFEKIEAALVAKQNLQGALEVMGDEKQLLAEPSPVFWGRLSSLYEKRANQVASGAGLADAGAPEQQQVMAMAAQLRSKAAEASIAQAKGLVVSDNEGYGAALWRAIELYDKAGAAQSAIAVMELYVRERPSDPVSPECMLRLGRAYMATGQFDRAISAFERCQLRYGRSWAATQAAIPLAQSLIAKGNKSYGQAEQVLLNLLDNNLAVTPEAVEFRVALHELAGLYYREGKLEEAIARFDELLKRYPTDDRVGEIYFQMGDAFRKSSALLAKADAQGAVVDAAEADTARRERLVKAKALFDKVVNFYREHMPGRDAEKAELRLAHFYRADCAFDLGQYEEAIKLYDQAAFRYQDDASSLAAYVQIVNANVALGKLAEARTANERAKWLLKRMPASAFTDGPGGMSRAYWDQWLRWSGETSMGGQQQSRGAPPAGANIADGGRVSPK